MWQVSICSQLVISSWVSSHLTAWFSVPASWIPSFFFLPPFFSSLFFGSLSLLCRLLVSEPHVGWRAPLPPPGSCIHLFSVTEAFSCLFFQTQSVSVCRSLRSGFLSASSRGCRCKLLHFPLKRFITEELTVKPNLLSVHPYRSRRLQRDPIPVRSRGSVGTKTHRYRSKFISQIHFLFSYVFKNESIRTAAYRHRWNKARAPIST